MTFKKLNATGSDTCCSNGHYVCISNTYWGENTGKKNIITQVMQSETQQYLYLDDQPSTKMYPSDDIFNTSKQPCGITLL